MTTIRNLELGDDAQSAEIARLLADAARADGHEPIGEHKFLHVRRGNDRASAFVADDGGRIAGYAQMLTYGEGDASRASLEFVVAPGWRGRGLGAALLERATSAARRVVGARRIDVWAYNDSRVSQRMAKALGFTAARRLLHLHRHMAATRPVAALPPGTALRPFVRGVDEGLLISLNARIFAGHPEQGAWTHEDLEARIAQPWFEAEDVLIAERAGIAVGLCWLKVERRQGEGTVGEIYVIGVAPEARGSGMGRALLAAGLARLRRRHADVAAIYVDASNAAAVALYESAGFHYHHVDVCYRLELAHEGATPLETAAA